MYLSTAALLGVAILLLSCTAPLQGAAASKLQASSVGDEKAKEKATMSDATTKKNHNGHHQQQEGVVVDIIVPSVSAADMPMWLVAYLCSSDPPHSAAESSSQLGRRVTVGNIVVVPHTLAPPPPINTKTWGFGGAEEEEEDLLGSLGEDPAAVARHWSALLRNSTGHEEPQQQQQCGVVEVISPLEGQSAEWPAHLARSTWIGDAVAAGIKRLAELTPLPSPVGSPRRFVTVIPAGCVPADTEEDDRDASGAGGGGGGGPASYLESLVEPLLMHHKNGEPQEEEGRGEAAVASCILSNLLPPRHDDGDDGEEGDDDEVAEQLLAAEAGRGIRGYELLHRNNFITKRGARNPNSGDHEAGDSSSFDWVAFPAKGHSRRSDEHHEATTSVSSNSSTRSSSSINLVVPICFAMELEQATRRRGHLEQVTSFVDRAAVAAMDDEDDFHHIFSTNQAWAVWLWLTGTPVVETTSGATHQKKKEKKKPGTSSSPVLTPMRQLTSHANLQCSFEGFHSGRRRPSRAPPTGKMKAEEKNSANNNSRKPLVGNDDDGDDDGSPLRFEEMVHHPTVAAVLVNEHLILPQPLVLASRESAFAEPPAAVRSKLEAMKNILVAQQQQQSTKKDQQQRQPTIPTPPPMRVAVLWNHVCCRCCGFSEEIEHLLLPLAAAAAQGAVGAQSTASNTTDKQQEEHPQNNNVPDVLPTMTTIVGPECFCGGGDATLDMDPVRRAKLQFLTPHSVGDMWGWILDATGTPNKKQTAAAAAATRSTPDGDDADVDNGLVPVVWVTHGVNPLESRLTGDLLDKLDQEEKKLKKRAGVGIGGARGLAGHRKMEARKDSNAAAATSKASTSGDHSGSEHQHHQRRRRHRASNKRPVFVVARCMHEFSRHPFADLLNDSRIDAIWAPAQAVKRSMVSAGVPADKIRIVPEAVDTDFFDPAVHSRAAAAKPLLRHPRSSSKFQHILDTARQQDLDSSSGSGGGDGAAPHQAYPLLPIGSGTTSSHAPPSCPQRSFAFLSIFKWEQRKGWRYLIRSFMETFARHHSDEASDNKGANTNPAAGSVSLVILTKRFGAQFSEASGARHNVTGIFEEDIIPIAKEVARDLNLLLLHPNEGHAEKKKLPNRRHRTKVKRLPTTAETLALMRTGALPQLVLIGDDLPQSDIAKLYSETDAFVLPTMGEGWGLPTAQAMSMSKPVLTTNWGGTTEFATPDTARLIDVERLEPVPSKGSGYFTVPGMEWAVPSVPHLSALMKDTVRSHYAPRPSANSSTSSGEHKTPATTPTDNSALGVRARARMVRHFSEGVVRDIIKRELAQLLAPPTAGNIHRT